MGARLHSTSGICLLRLSAIGDVAHTIAVVRTLRQTFPERPLTWVVGRVEAGVAGLVPGIELIVVNKNRPLHELWRVRRLLRGRRFDALLHMQVAFRSNLISLGVPARERIGFDRARAKEGHRLVVTRRVAPAPAPGEHVLDGLMRFAKAVGAEQPVYRWDLALPPEAEAWARQTAPQGQRMLAVNVCASRPVKDWLSERFAAVVAYAVRTHQLPVVLCGGRSAQEQRMAAAIVAQCGVPVQNLVGRTSLPQLIALLRRCVALLSPDSGPCHLATAVGTPVIGLYGVTNLQRCGPYLDRRWCIDKREAAARHLLGRAPTSLRWDEVVPGGMALIQADEVCRKLDAVVTPD